MQNRWKNRNFSLTINKTIFLDSLLVQLYFLLTALNINKPSYTVCKNVMFDIEIK